MNKITINLHQPANFTDILTVAFIVLKLTHIIDWSWFWVVSPMWIMFILEIIAFFVVIKRGGYNE